MNKNGGLNIVAAVVCAIGLGVALEAGSEVAAAIETMLVASNLFLWFMCTRERAL